MKKNKIKGWVSLLIILSGLALIAVIFLPIWKIELSAPQYPEGLNLRIHANKLAGDVDVVNGLNHYIGMKTLHADDFVEFTVLPYIIGFFGILALLTGILRSRKLLNLLTILFILFAVVAMADFWKWEYDYGHNLNPAAAIRVPGMTYQPPLIGYKQLLNFGAYSVPAIGGWIFVAVGIIFVLAVIVERKKKKGAGLTQASMITAILCLFLASCNSGPQPIQPGVDNCTFCKMSVADNRFGAELITKKGKVFKFDDTHCLTAFLKSGDVAREDIGSTYFTDFTGNHQLHAVTEVKLLKSEAFKSPMGGNIAAFSNNDSFSLAKQKFNAEEVNTNELLK